MTFEFQRPLQGHDWANESRHITWGRGWSLSINVWYCCTCKTLKRLNFKRHLSHLSLNFSTSTFLLFPAEKNKSFYLFGLVDVLYFIDWRKIEIKRESFGHIKRNRLAWFCLPVQISIANSWHETYLGDEGIRCSLAVIIDGDAHRKWQLRSILLVSSRIWCVSNLYRQLLLWGYGQLCVRMTCRDF